MGNIASKNIALKFIMETDCCFQALSQPLRLFQGLLSRSGMPQKHVLASVYHHHHHLPAELVGVAEKDLACYFLLQRAKT